MNRTNVDAKSPSDQKSLVIFSILTNATFVGIREFLGGTLPGIGRYLSSFVTFQENMSSAPIFFATLKA